MSTPGKVSGMLEQYTPQQLTQRVLVCAAVCQGPNLAAQNFNTVASEQ